MSRSARVTLFAAIAVAAACGEKAAEAPARPTGHLFTSASAGIGLDLPTVWAGRYRVTDSVTRPVDGLENEIAFRFVRADSTVVTEPLMVVRVFETSAWKSIPPDAANGLFGTVIASDDARTVAVRTIPGNPLNPGTADALAFDSLMMVVIQRPLRASLRQ